MTTLINSLNSKKDYSVSVLNKIHLKNNNDINNYSSKELRRCAMIIKQIKTIEFQLDECRKTILNIA